MTKGAGRQAQKWIVLLGLFIVLLSCISSQSYMPVFERVIANNFQITDKVARVEDSKNRTKEEHDFALNTFIVIPDQTLPLTNGETKEPTSLDMKTKYYSVARTDRAGAQILDLLLLDAYAYRMKGAVGGACVDWVDFDAVPPGPTLEFPARLEEKKEMLKFLGLDDVLSFACPTQQDIDDGHAVIADRLEYGKTRKTFTPSWYEHLITTTNFPYDPPRAPNTPLKVAVHIRRGDYDPCIPTLRKKYLPNEYYLRVLDGYLPTACISRRCDVTIYTDNVYKKELLEDFDPFRARNFTIDFDSPIKDIWRAFINADVLVISKSSFSLVPALLNRNQVIVPDLNYKVDKMNLPHWILVPEDITTASEFAVEALVMENCDV